MLSNEPVMRVDCVGRCCVAPWELLLLGIPLSHAAEQDSCSSVSSQVTKQLQSSCKCIMDSNHYVVATLQTVLTSPHLKSITENTGAVLQSGHRCIQCTQKCSDLLHMPV